ERVERLDGRVIDEGHAVPQHVAGRGVQQVRVLPDAQLRRRPDGPEALTDLLDDGLVLALALRQRGPLLPSALDVLPVLQTDRAPLRRRIARRVLGAAGDADVARHGVLLTMRWKNPSPQPPPRRGEGEQVLRVHGTAFRIPRPTYRIPAQRSSKPWF